MYSWISSYPSDPPQWQWPVNNWSWNTYSVFFIQIQYTVHPKHYAESLLFIEFHTDVFKGYFTDIGGGGQNWAIIWLVHASEGRWISWLIWTHWTPKKDDVTTARQRKIESCAYVMGYSVHTVHNLLPPYTTDSEQLVAQQPLLLTSINFNTNMDK